MVFITKKKIRHDVGSSGCAGWTISPSIYSQCKAAGHACSAFAASVQASSSAAEAKAEADVVTGQFLLPFIDWRRDLHFHTSISQVGQHCNSWVLVRPKLWWLRLQWRQYQQHPTPQKTDKIFRLKYLAMEMVISLKLSCKRYWLVDSAAIGGGC